MGRQVSAGSPLHAPTSPYAIFRLSQSSSPSPQSGTRGYCCRRAVAEEFTADGL